MAKLAARALGLMLLCCSTTFWAQAPLSSEAYRKLKYRYIGPVGNRATAVVGIAGNPWIYYVGAASGGIFKTTDGGTHSEPIFEGQDLSSIGSPPFDPTAPHSVWTRHQRVLFPHPLPL